MKAAAPNWGTNRYHYIKKTGTRHLSRFHVETASNRMQAACRGP